MDSPGRQGSQRHYQESGVDIDAADQLKHYIADRVKSTHGPDVLREVGHFGGFFRVPKTAHGNVLVASADSVGTKVLIASLAADHSGIGRDLVNHSVNDILACGARPLFFLDYYATPDLDAAATRQIIDGMVDACREAGCALIGGETAQLPGIYRERTYDLAGFIVGIVPESQIIDGASVREGDLLIGLPSSGLHTNGYSLARKVFGLSLDDDLRTVQTRLEEVLPISGVTIAQALLEPHRSYLELVQPLLDSNLLTGMAHVTGGGLPGNVERVIPTGLQADIDVSRWSPPEIFTVIESRGGIAQSEMYRVFNMGIGFVLITRPEHAPDVSRMAGGTTIGRVTQGHNGERVVLSGIHNDRAEDLTR